MRTLLTFTLLITFLCNAFAQNKDLTPWKYVELYRDLAVKEMQRTGVPASIKLGQGILESRFGTSELAVKANNHFGKKSHKDWKGMIYKVLTTEYDKAGILYKDSAFFKKYENVENGYLDHSEYLKRKRFENAFKKCPPTDCMCWAYEIKMAGYATNPKYDTLLVNTIKKYKLGKYDTLALKGQAPTVITLPTEATVKSEEMTLAQLKTEIEKQLKKSNSPELKNQLAQLALFEQKYNTIATQNAELTKRSFTIIVQKGDTPRKLAELYGVPVENIFLFNGLRPTDVLKIGQELNLKSNTIMRGGLGLPFVAIDWHNFDADEYENETFKVEEPQVLLQFQLRVDFDLTLADVQLLNKGEVFKPVKGSESLKLVKDDSESVVGKNVYIYSATVDFAKLANALQAFQLKVKKERSEEFSPEIGFLYKK
ncbi:MAG: glucosaminidase domain-containing protein [Bacteroidia bacterium]